MLLAYFFTARTQLVSLPIIELQSTCPNFVTQTVASSVVVIVPVAVIVVHDSFDFRIVIALAEHVPNYLSSWLIPVREKAPVTLPCFGERILVFLVFRADCVNNVVQFPRRYSACSSQC